MQMQIGIAVRVGNLLVVDLAEPDVYKRQISDGSGQMINTNACGPEIGAEINLPEVSISLPAEATLQFDTQPDTVTVKCLKKGSSVEDICNIDRSDGNYTFSLKTDVYKRQVERQRKAHGRN